MALFLFFVGKELWEALVLERGAERPLGIEKNAGPWSLFRFFDLMQSEPASGRDAQVLKADLAGLRANYLLLSFGLFALFVCECGEWEEDRQGDAQGEKVLGGQHIECTGLLQLQVELVHLLGRHVAAEEMADQAYQRPDRAHPAGYRIHIGAVFLRHQRQQPDKQ